MVSKYLSIAMILYFPIIQSDQGYLLHITQSTAQLQRNMFQPHPQPNKSQYDDVN